jgi:ABC-2 type transport system permease protein
MATRDAGFLFTICDYPMNFFSAVKIPIIVFPFWTKIISAIYPSTYCIHIIREIFIENSVDFTKIMGLLICLAIIVVITYIITRITETYNRETGNLQFY